MVAKFGCTCNHLINMGYHILLYGNVSRKLKQNPNALKIHLNKLICKGYRHIIIIKSLNMVFIETNIDL